MSISSGRLPDVRWVVGVASCIIAAGSAVILYSYRNRAEDFAAGLALALSLFVVRRDLRWLYGLIEIGFAIYALWDATGKALGDFSRADMSPDFKTFALSVLVIQTLGAIYVLIRGLDNFVQGVPKLKAWWEALY